MEDKTRRIGLDAMPSIIWGSHLCLLYRTKQELLDILIPYFKTGLEDNEYCIWATSEHLGTAEAFKELGESVADLDGYITKGQLEILDSRELYTREGKFDQEEVLSRWLEKEVSALNNGFSGLRAAGYMDCIDQKDWPAIIQYEQIVDFAISRHRVIALCAYPLDSFEKLEPVELTANHAIVLFNRSGKWMAIQNSRSAKVHALKKSGLNYVEIGRMLGVTQQRVHQMINKKRSRQQERSSLLTTAEAARLLSVHVNTIRRWSTEGTLRPYRFGTRGDRRFERQDLDEFLRKTV
ncbi:MAG: MEDS domain-containing protein [Chloroflexota bacterium]